MYNAKNYQKVKKLWDNGVGQRFFRCAKEFGIYSELRAKFGANKSPDFLQHYINAINFLHNYNYLFSIRPNKCSYESRKLYEKSKRHTLILVCYVIITNLYISNRKKNDFLKEMDKFIFKKYDLLTIIREFYYAEGF